MFSRLRVSPAGCDLRGRGEGANRASVPFRCAGVTLIFVSCTVSVHKGRHGRACPDTVAPVTLPRIEIDGRAVSVPELYTAMVNYGHFTAAQVRGRAIRGIDVHLDRLDAANRELFDLPLPGDRVRDLVRHALADDVVDASVRVYAFLPDGAAGVSVMVTVNPPAVMPPGPLRLRSVDYLRPMPHIKHVGTFGQGHYGRKVARAGYDEALLTGPHGEISEGAVTNVGFFDGTGVVWPATPHLVGTAMRLLDRGLAARGVPVRREVVRVADVSGFRAAFVANSRGIAAVGQIDDVPFPVDDDLMKALAEALDATGWDSI
jgi:branched-subunit amino acid aminotransferase/4-amino-4-deoxychorismate lyase